MQKFTQSSNDKEIKEKLNNAKILSPLISAAIASHGNASSEEFQAATESLGQILDTTVESVLHEIMPSGDVPISIRASTSVALAPLIAHAWQQAPGKVEASQISEAFLGLVKFTRPDPGMVFNPHMPRASSHALAEARAASKILPVLFKLESLPLQTQKLFIGNYSISQLRDTCLHDIRGMAKNVASNLEPSDQRQQDIAYRSALNCIAEVYAETLSQEYKKLNSTLIKLRSDDPKKRQEFMRELQSDTSPMLLRHVRPKIRQSVTLLYPVNEVIEYASPQF